MPTTYFAHGVASGDPLPTAVVLWTRVTPTTASKPGLGCGPTASVTWQVSTSRAFASVVKTGTVSTSASRDHTVKVDVDRAEAGDRPTTTGSSTAARDSRVGRTRTAPAPTSSPANLRVGVVSCANLQAGWFSAYRHLADRNDLRRDRAPRRLHLRVRPRRVRLRQGRPSHPAARTGARDRLTLADYRQRHAQYKRDTDLQRLHAKYAFICTWDDHESANDAYGTARRTTPRAPRAPGKARRAASHQAYDEWMPVRMSGTAALGDGDRLFRRLQFGDLARAAHARPAQLPRQAARHPGDPA